MTDGQAAADAHLDDVQAVLIDVGAIVVPGRYRRIAQVAGQLGWDPAVLLDHTVGAVVVPPESGIVQHPDPDGARARADRGAATWAEAMAALADAVNAAGGPPWDERTYWSALTALHPAVDVTYTLSQVLRGPRPIGLLASGPAEFADGIDARLPAGARVWHTCRLGVGKPEAWDRVLVDLGLTDADPSTILVVDDAWGPQESMRGHGHRTLWLDGDDAIAEWMAIAGSLAP